MQVLGSHRKQEEIRGKFQQLSFNPKAQVAFYSENYLSLKQQTQ